MESQAKLYNDCNPRDDSYCIFEKDYKDLKWNVTNYLEYIKSLKPFTKEYKNLDHVIVDLEKIVNGQNPTPKEGERKDV